MKVRVLIAIMGLDQHDSGAVAVSKALRDAGMEVIYAGRFNLPTMIVNMAEEEDVEVIGISCHSWEYVHYLPELLRLLKEEDLNIPVIAGGSIITSLDEKELVEKGVAATFGPNSTHQEIIQRVQELGSD